MYYILKFLEGDYKGKVGLTRYELLGQRGFETPEQAYQWLEQATGNRGGTIVIQLTVDQISSDWTTVIDYSNDGDDYDDLEDDEVEDYY